DRVGDLGDDRLLVADDAREERPALPEPCQQVAAQFLLDGFPLVSGGAELGNCPGLAHQKLECSLSFRCRAPSRCGSVWRLPGRRGGSCWAAIAATPPSTRRTPWRRSNRPSQPAATWSSATCT